MKATSSRLHVSSTVNTTGKIYERMEDEREGWWFLFIWIQLDCDARKQINISVNWPYPNTNDWYNLAPDFLSFFLLALSFIFLLIYGKLIYFWKATL